MAFSWWACPIAQEKLDGKLMGLWSAQFPGELSTVDIAPALADVMASKDAAEVMNVKKAAFLCSSVVTKYVVLQMEGEAGERGDFNEDVAGLRRWV